MTNSSKSKKHELKIKYFKKSIRVYGSNQYKELYYLGALYILAYYCYKSYYCYLDYKATNRRDNLLYSNLIGVLFSIVSISIYSFTKFYQVRKLVKILQIMYSTVDFVIAFFFEFFVENYPILQGRILINRQIIIRSCLLILVYSCMYKRLNYKPVLGFIIIIYSIVLTYYYNYLELTFFDCPEIITVGVFGFLMIRLNRCHNKIMKELIKSKLKIKESNDYIKGIIDSLQISLITIRKNKSVLMNKEFKSLFKSHVTLHDGPKKERSSKTWYKHFFEFIQIKSFTQCLNKSKSPKHKIKASLLDTFYQSMKNIDSRKNLSESIDCLLKQESDNGPQFMSLGVFENHEMKANGLEKYFEILIRNFHGLINKNNIDLIINDITILKLNERQRAESSLKANIFGKIVHEFKTPLITITTELESLEEQISTLKFEESTNKNELESNKAIKQKVIETSKSIRHLSQYTIFLINDIINYGSKSDEICLNIKEIELNACFRFCVNIMNVLVKYSTALKGNVKANSEFDLSIESFTIKSDETRIKQILINIISNAVKFTQSGSISIKCFPLSDKLREENAQLSKINDELNCCDLICISITDTGKGFSTDQIDAINSKTLIQKMNSDFYNNSMGTGLGIGIVKHLCQRLNFKLELISILGKGSVFNLYIPCTKKQQMASSEKSIKSSQSICTSQAPLKSNRESLFCKNPHLEKMPGEAFELKTERSISSMNTPIINLQTQSWKGCCPNDEVKYIIICDDSKIILNSLHKLLLSIPGVSESHRIVLAYDGLELINKVVDISIEKGTISLIISDESMEFINGSLAMNILKSIESKGKLRKCKANVCLTAFDEDYSNSNLLKSGFDMCLSKPVSKSILVAALEKFNIILTSGLCET